MVGKLRIFGPVGVVHKTSSCDRADRGSPSFWGVDPRSQFRGETLPIEGTLLRSGDGDVRCELSMEDEPSILFMLVARWLRSVPRDSCGAAAATRGEWLLQLI